MDGTSVGILGAGAWGTAIGAVIARKGVPVTLWSHDDATAVEITARHTNERALPGAALPDALTATADIAAAADGKDFLFLAVPSLYLLDTLEKVLGCPSVRDGRTVFAVLTKGFVEYRGSVHLITEAMEDVLPGMYRNKLVYVSGPSHAVEVVRGTITGLISASRSGRNSIRVRELLSGGPLVVFSSLDLRGVQVSAALKNVVAVAFGILDALKESSLTFGDNTESLLLAAGLREITVLGRALGATHAETFTSIAGVGDLDVTCRSPHGRNRRFGREIVLKGLLEGCGNIDEVIDALPRVGYTAEGVVTARWAHQLAAQHRLSFPILGGVYRILNREAEPLAEVGAMLEMLNARSKPGRRWRGASALLRGTAGWASRLARRG